MDSRKIIKDTEAIAVGSWISYLNSVRIEKAISEMNEKISNQNFNFYNAIKEINKTIIDIDKKIIEKNRGGTKGMHGFIAEAAQVGVGNAYSLLKGEKRIYKWVNDNGPSDLFRNGVHIQQKFVNSGGKMSLDATKEHLEKYLDFLNKGGKYQIPKDHYDRIIYYLNIPENVANKMPTSNGDFSLKEWKYVHDFFKDEKINLKDLESSRFTYSSVQKNKIHNTLNEEKDKIEDINENIKEEIKINSKLKQKPTFKEGMKATFISAGIEGSTTFVLLLINKIKKRKNISNFTEEDWKEILKESGKDTVKGGVRGASIYALTNFTSITGEFASSMVTAGFGLAEQVNKYKKGEIDEIELIQNSELVCLEASISGLSSFIGQTLIPIPVLGAVIGNTVGTMIYGLSQKYFNEKEQKIYQNYYKRIISSNIKFGKEYNELIDLLNDSLKIYFELVEDAFSVNIYKALKGSIALAKEIGVNEENILDSEQKILEYFMI